MMYFAQEAIERLSINYQAMPAKQENILTALLARQYQVPRAQEFAAHGVSRRLKTMLHCVERIFAVLPPEREDIPSTEELVDAMVYLQAFTFNAFACLDNLAWIWVCERKLTTDKGEEIAPTRIGLGKKCRIVRRSFPTDLRKHLKSLDPWFEHLENFRHALAHRIPLYIPPRVVSAADFPMYERLGRRMAKAIKRGNFQRYAQLKAAQESLTKFEPVTMHSVSDDSRRIVFHPQLLEDLNTICDLVGRLNRALDTEVPQVRRKFWAMIFSVRKFLGRVLRI